MERREFLNWVGTGAIASFLPVAIAACGSSPDTSSQAPATDTATADAGDGRINMGTAADLDSQGFLYSKADDIMVVKNEDGSLSALNSKCTHQQCPVEWDSDAANLFCACHGSVFSTDGSVITGPASTPLASYASVVEEGGNILVSVS